MKWRLYRSSVKLSSSCSVSKLSTSSEKWSSKWNFSVYKPDSRRASNTTHTSYLSLSIRLVRIARYIFYFYTVFSRPFRLNSNSGRLKWAYVIGQFCCTLVPSYMNATTNGNTMSHDWKSFSSAYISDPLVWIFYSSWGAHAVSSDLLSQQEIQFHVLYSPTVC